MEMLCKVQNGKLRVENTVIKHVLTEKVLDAGKQLEKCAEFPGNHEEISNATVGMKTFLLLILDDFKVVKSDEETVSENEQPKLTLVQDLLRVYLKYLTDYYRVGCDEKRRGNLKLPPEAKTTRRGMRETNERENITQVTVWKRITETHSDYSEDSDAGSEYCPTDDPMVIKSEKESLQKPTRCKRGRPAIDVSQKTCKVCQKVFPYSTMLRTHMTKVHSGVSKGKGEPRVLRTKSVAYRCSCCPTVFRSAKMRTKHELVNHKKDRKLLKKNICQECNEVFKTKKRLMRHAIDVHELSRCYECDIDFTKFEEHEQHNRKQHSQYFVCQYCGKKFKSRCYWRDHESMHKGKKFECKKCDKTFVSSKTLKFHMFMHEPDIHLPCEKCGKMFATQRLLKQHVDTHEEPAHQCGKCNKMFKSERNMRRHIEACHEVIDTSQPDAFILCSVCGKRVFSQSELRMHTRRFHTKELPFKCCHCEKRFVCKGDQRKHERVHTGEKNFECHQCKRKFRDSSTLCRHLHTHLSFKPFGCQVCGSGFTQMTTFKKHALVAHHYEENYQDILERRIGRSSTLKYTANLSDTKPTKPISDTTKGPLPPPVRIKDIVNKAPSSPPQVPPTMGALKACLHQPNQHTALMMPSPMVQGQVVPVYSHAQISDMRAVGVQQQQLAPVPGNGNNMLDVQNVQPQGFFFGRMYGSQNAQLTQQPHPSTPTHAQGNEQQTQLHLQTQQGNSNQTSTSQYTQPGFQFQSQPAPGPSQPPNSQEETEAIAAFLNAVSALHNQNDYQMMPSGQNQMHDQ